MTIDPTLREKVIQLHLENCGRLGRRQIARLLTEQGFHISERTVGNIVHQHGQKPSQLSSEPLQNTSHITESVQPAYSSQPPKQLDRVPESIKNQLTQDFGENGFSHVEYELGRKGAPLNWFTNSFQELSGGGTSLHTSSARIAMGSPTSTAPRYSGVVQPIINSSSTTENNSFCKDSTSKVPKKVYPRNPIEDRFFELDRKAWDYYGHAQTPILEQINKEKDRRRYELFLIDSRKGKLEVWRKKLDERESNIKDREARIRSFEPYLLLAKKLCEMKLTLGDALHWIHTITEVAQTKNMDIKAATVYVAQELRQCRQLGGIEKKIERANQELTLINMAAIKKQQALTVVEDLINNRGITSEQIAQLNWNKHNGNPPLW